MGKKHKGKHRRYRNVERMWLEDDRQQQQERALDEEGAQAALLQLLEVCVGCGLPVTDPLLDTCLRAVARWQVTDLRIKARLLVKKGVTLMGVMDEYGVLEEDEVFVQVQQRGCDSLAGTIITGRVMLAKHPVAHRGDVRVVTAVNPADTTTYSSSSRHPQRYLLAKSYVNVVVFSQKGERPLPNKLSGSDLDGDLYHVHWDPDLLPPETSAPMDYSAELPDKVPEVTPEHLQDHFVNFAKNDKLGQISTWLLAQADKNGADCMACERLAQLHSMAVDFPKTGRPAELKSLDELRLLRPSEYPHWMEKPDQPMYRSETVLGRMYDEVMTHPAAKDLVDSSTPAVLRIETDRQQRGIPEFWPGQLLQVPGVSPGYHRFLAQAKQHFSVFEHELVALMNHWQVYDVGQMVTGCLPRLQRQVQRHQHSQQRAQLNRELRGVFGRARAAFLHLLLLQQQPAAAHYAANSITLTTNGTSSSAAADMWPESLEDLSVKTLRAMVDAQFSVSSSSSSAAGSMGQPAVILGAQQRQLDQDLPSIDDRHRCAAAYMCVAYKQLVHKEDMLASSRRTAGSVDVTAGPDITASDDNHIVDDVGGSDSGSDEDDDAGDESDDDRDKSGGGGSKPGSKEWETQQHVRLCFQLVVSRELAQLARWV